MGADIGNSAIISTSSYAAVMSSSCQHHALQELGSPTGTMGIVGGELTLIYYLASMSNYEIHDSCL